MLILLLLELLEGILMCNCSVYKKECVPYCKTTYVYQNKLERDNVTGDVKVVNKKPYINYVRNKIKGNDTVQSQVLIQNNLHTPNKVYTQVPDIVHMSKQVVNYPIPSLKYELNDNILRYNNVDYDFCNDSDQLRKHSEFNAELNRIYEMILSNESFVTQCRNLNMKSARKTTTKTIEETITRTITVEKTSIQTKSSTHTITLTSTITTTKKVEQIQTQILKTINKPNPNINTTIKLPCTDYISSNCSIIENSQNVVTVTKDLPKISTVFVIRSTSNNPPTLSYSTSTVIKTSIIPKISTVTMTKKITSLRTSTKVKPFDIQQTSRATKTKYITSFKTATKTILKPKIAINTQKQNESTMYSVLLLLKDLLTKVNDLSEHTKTSTKTIKNDELEFETVHPSGSKYVDQDKFKSILQELANIKSLNMRLIKKKEETQNNLSQTDLSNSKDKQAVLNNSDRDNKSLDEFYKKIHEVQQIQESKDKDNRKIITETKTVTINKSNSLSSSVESAKHEESVQNTVNISKSPITDKHTITLHMTLTKTITEPKIKNIFQIKTERQSITKTQSITITKPITSILHVTDLIKNTLTESIMEKTDDQSTTNSGFIGEFKDKFFNIFKKPQQPASMESFHKFVSENLVSLASAISDIKKTDSRSDQNVEKTVTIEEDKEKKIEKQITSMKEKFDKMIESLKLKISNEGYRKAVSKDEDSKEHNVVLKGDSKEDDKEDDSKEIETKHIILDDKTKEQDDDNKKQDEIKYNTYSDKQMKLTSVVLFSMTPLSTTIQSKVKIQDTISLKDVLSSSSSVFQSLRTLKITQVPDSVTIKTISPVSIIPIIVQSSTNKTYSTKPFSIDKSTISFIEENTILSVEKATQQSSDKSEYKLSQINSRFFPISSTVSKSKLCKENSAECIIDIPITKIPKSLDIIYE